jgi:hypothetical protein
VVPIVGALASQVAGWIGGVILVAILPGIAALFNPQSV